MRRRKMLGIWLAAVILLAAAAGVPHVRALGGWCDDSTNSHIVSPKRMLASAGNGWLARLYRHKVFYERAVTMYYEELVPYLRALTGLDPSDTVVPLLERGNQLAASARLNFTRWPVLSSVVPVNTGKTYDDNIVYLNNWLIKRMDYLDSVWMKDYERLRGS